MPSVSEQLEGMELCPGMGEELTESLWARIKGRAGTGGIIDRTHAGRPAWMNKELLAKLKQKKEAYRG